MLLPEDIIRDLKTFSFTEELTEQELKKIAQHSTIQEVTAGTVLAEKVGNCEALALIVSGQLRISRLSEDGREVTLQRIKNGRTCPLSAACILGGLDGFSAKITADEKTRIIWIESSFIINSLIDIEPFWRFIFSCMATRLYETMEVLDSIAFVPVKKRLAQIIIDKSGAGRQPIYATHEALARELGTVREVVSRQLKEWERAQMLTLSRGRLVIKNTEEFTKLIKRS